MGFTFDNQKDHVLIHLDSRNANTVLDTTNFSDVEFILDSQVDISDVSDTMISLDSFEVPNPYNITQYSNKQYFQYNCSGMLSASDCLVTMTPGAYILDSADSNDNLKNTLQDTLLTEIQKNTTLVGQFDNLTISYSDLTKKLTFNTSNTPQNCSLSVSLSDTSNNTLTEFLGFRHSNTAMTPSASFVSNNVINMIKPSSIYIMTDLPITAQLDSRYSLNAVRTLQRIPNTALPSSLLIYDGYENSTKHKVYDNFIYKIRIKLEDELRNPINLQGLYFTMTLKLQHVKRDKRGYRMENIYNDIASHGNVTNQVITSQSGVPSMNYGNSIL